MPTAKITQTSSDSATVEPIVLRDGKQTRLVFKPQLVNNAHDENKPVRGALLWQRRGASEQDQEWVDESQVRLSSMTAGSGVKLDLSTDELYTLTQAVRGLYGFFWQHDNQLPHTGEEFELADYAQAAKTLDNIDEVATIIATSGADGFAKVLQVLSRNDRTVDLVAAIERLELADLAGITSLAGIGMLRQVLSIWEANKGNNAETFWQELFAQYSFVFSQLFSSPVVVLQNKAYVGGKDIAGAGGKFPDYLLQNQVTSHVLIVEIKTPESGLLARRAYREPDVYAMDRELSGALTQLAKYKQEFMQNFPTLYTKSEGGFLCADPRCLLVIGSTDHLNDRGMLDSFEHIRRSQRYIEIVTFNELFCKVEMLLELLEGGH